MKEAEILIKGNGKGMLALFVILVILLSVIITSIIVNEMNDVEAEPPEKYSKLYIDDVYFLLPDYTRGTGEKINLNVNPFITNRGNIDSGDVKIVIFAIDQEKNIAVDKSSESFGTVSNDTTLDSELSLELNDNSSYRIELLIFEREKIVLKGSGTVKLREIGSYGEDFRSSNGNEKSPISGSGTKESDDGLGMSSGIASICGIMMILVVIIVIGLLLTKKFSLNKFQKSTFETQFEPPFPISPPIENKPNDNEILYDKSDILSDEKLK